MNNITLILPTNGRPLFAGKNLLERITFTERYSLIDDTVEIPTQELLANKIAMKAFIHMLIDFEKLDINRTDEDYKLLVRFPLFLDSQFVQEWEEDKIWKNFNLDNHIIKTYEEKINGKTPSIAYMPSVCGYANEIWKYYFLNASLIDLVTLIDDSIKCIDNYIEKRVYKKNTDLEINISNIAHFFKLEAVDIFALHWMSILFNSHLNHIDKLWSRLLSINSYNATKFFGTIEKSLGISTGSMLDRLSTNKPLINCLLFKEVSTSNLSNDLIKNNCRSTFEGVFSEIFTSLQQKTLRTNYGADNSIINEFIKQNHETPLALSHWDYLNGILNVWRTQLITTPTKILFYGEKGCGKTSLAISLLNSIKMDIFMPVDKDNESYMISSYLVKQMDNACLLVNNNKELFLKENIVDLNDINLIWTVDTLDKIPEHQLKHFDYIYNLSDIPFENRLNFANDKFKDHNLAIKIAQQLKTFGSIEKASTLVSTEDEWKTIYPHVNIEKRKLGDNFQVVDYNSFKDIPDLSGYKDLYRSFDTILDLFNNPYKYKRLDAKIPKGFLIEGKPGTGKTLFVKQIAKRSQLPLIVANSSQLAKNLNELKDVFDYARLIAPCILFFDEIDTLLTNPQTPFSVDTDKQQILNTMLSELDGVKSLTGVIVLGTTNHLKNISPIALRSGRISEVISVGIPSSSDRIEIWESYLTTKPTEMINYEHLSKISNGFSGADIAEAANQSALIAAYENSDLITTEHIDKACESVLFGRADGQLIINNDVLLKTATHEVGHALMALNFNRDVGRVTIVPRQGALGVTHVLQEEGFYNFNKTEMEEMICIFLGGIAAEKVIFGEYDSGGASDLDTISRKIFQAYMSLGFSSTVGPIATQTIDKMSEKRLIALEEESTDLVNKLFIKTVDLLTNNKQLLLKCADELFTLRSLSGEVIERWRNELKNINSL